MNVVDELIEIFRKFPGVGPRQAERFVFFLLRQPKSSLNKIATLVPSLADKVKTCDDCKMFFVSEHHTPLCNICIDKNRDHSILMIVGQDTDQKSIEKSDYNGVYFILGGLVPVLEKDPQSKIRLKELHKVIEKRAKEDGLNEIIIALNANPEGENTTDIVRKEITDFASKNNIKVSVLGRGLSTGTELEYSDAETIKNALKNRF